MASIPHKTKTGVRHEMSGSGFHTPSKYGKNDRKSEKELIEEEFLEIENSKRDNKERNAQG